MENETRWKEVAYNVTKLYPSIPVDKAVDVILQQVSKDYEDLKKRTKIALVDVQKLIEFFVSECFFLWDSFI